ncbi:hypothetical protein [Pontibacter ruber]|uniref:Uncharacterized protein n=1 Tax=Pontibacter ruber TaxID=1343895 RepID=A0ABW5CYE7_9BACT|nr:hypothetical protein [Pontibacter ruber]
MEQQRRQKVSNSSWYALLFSIALSGCASKHFFPDTPLADPADMEALAANPPVFPDSVTIQAGKHYRHGRVYNFFFGKHYRQLWTAPVRVRVLQLSKEKGGLKIEKVGGSMQTTSFTLTDANGVSYALRSIDKDPAGSMPSFLRHTLAADFMRDQTAALNPYAALAVAPLAAAAGIPQATPELVYLPASDPALGEYREVAGDKVYMLEKKYTDRSAITPALGPAVNIVSTKDMLRKRYAENTHQVDQQAFAKARLFDLLLNDRDRHEGQWNWAVYQEKGKTVYRPIPKDRDQALYKFAHGVLPKLVGQGLNYQKYNAFYDDYRNLSALTLKSEKIDKQALPDVSLAEFEALARDLQQRLTDEVIEQAVHQFPKPIVELAGEATIHKLKKRRDLLPQAANAYYKMLAKEVMVAGTDQEERFEVKRLNDEHTEVTVTRKADEQVIYHRLFNRPETKEIKLYGLGGNDVFEISGTVRKGIELVIVANPADDEIIDNSRVGSGKRTVIESEEKEKFKFRPSDKSNPAAPVEAQTLQRKGS